MTLLFFNLNLSTLWLGLIILVSITQLKTKIKKDATTYDKLAREYNTLVRKERNAGRLIAKNGRVVAVKSTAGKNAAKRVIVAWNRVARKGKTLKSELEIYTKLQGRRTTTAKRITKRKR